MILSFETVKGVFEDILSHKISREDADQWAWHIMQRSEAEDIEFAPREKASAIWNALLYINGIDLPDSDRSYLHSDDDIRTELHKFMNDVYYMSTIQYEKLSLLLSKVLVHIENSISASDYKDVHDFIEANEFGLAFETIIDIILVEEIKIGTDSYADLESAAILMEMTCELAKRQH